jgi:tetratricopeptide (TPR) repeat protein
MIQLSKKIILLSVVTGLCLVIATRARDLHAPINSHTNTVTFSGAYLGALHSVKNNDFDNAAELFMRSLAFEPHNITLLRAAHIFNLNSGKFDNVIKLAKQNYKLEGAIAITLAIFYIQNKDYVAAERILNSSDHHKEFATDPLVPLLISWCKAANGDYLAAINVIENSHSLNNQQYRAKSLQLALINELADSASEAAKQYDSLLPTDSADLINIIGNFYERNKRYQEAEEIYQKNSRTSLFGQQELKRINNKRYSTIPVAKTINEKIALVLTEIARELLEYKQGHQAIIYAQLAFYLDKQESLAIFLIGNYYAQNNNHAKAVTYYNKIPSANWLYEQAQVEMATSVYQLGEKERAKQILISIDKANPKDIAPKLLLANIWRDEGRFNKATEIYSELVGNKEVKPSQIWYYFYMRGINYSLANQLEQAEQDFLKALDLSPSEATVMNDLGFTWLSENKNIPKAIEMIKAAYKALPDNPAVMDSMAWAYFNTSRYNEAKELLEQAVELTPAEPSINEHLGDVYWKLGDKINAKFEWKRAINYQTDPKSIDKLNSKLNYGL